MTGTVWAYVLMEARQQGQYRKSSEADRVDIDPVLGLWKLSQCKMKVLEHCRAELQHCPNHHQSVTKVRSSSCYHKKVSDSFHCKDTNREAFLLIMNYCHITHLSVCATRQRLSRRLESILFPSTKPGWTACNQGSPPSASKQKTMFDDLCQAEELHAYHTASRSFSLYRHK